MPGYTNGSTGSLSNSSTDEPQDSFYGGAIQKYHSELYYTNHLVASVNQKLNILIILKIVLILIGIIVLYFFYNHLNLKPGKK